MNQNKKSKYHHLAQELVAKGEIDFAKEITLPLKEWAREQLLAPSKVNK